MMNTTDSQNLSQETPPDQEAGQEGQTPHALLAFLKTQFAVFETHQPLVIGIDKLLFARFPETRKRTLRAALSLHTHATRYLRATSKGTHRVNLEGEPVAEITDEHRQHAAEILKQRTEKYRQNNAKNTNPKDVPVPETPKKDASVSEKPRKPEKPRKNASVPEKTRVGKPQTPAKKKPVERVNSEKLLLLAEKFSKK